MPNPGNIAKHKFKKGQTGNPNGRPKSLPAIKELLSEVLSDEVSGVDAAKRILRVIRNKALKGDLKAAELIMDRAYGKPKQEIETTVQAVNYNVDVSRKEMMEINKKLENDY